MKAQIQLLGAECHALENRDVPAYSLCADHGSRGVRQKKTRADVTTGGDFNPEKNHVQVRHHLRDYRDATYEGDSRKATNDQRKETMMKKPHEEPQQCRLPVWATFQPELPLEIAIQKIFQHDVACDIRPRFSRN